MNTTRRQHYVWQRYLRNWERNGRIVVLSKDSRKAFATDTTNIAVMRDFYRLPVLTGEDEDFMERFIESTCGKSDMLKALNQGWLDSIAVPSRLRRYLSGLGRLDPAIEAEIRQVEIQLDEKFQGRIESDAVRLIEALASGRSEIWSNDDDARDLAYFLSLQHLRTKKMRDNILAGFPAGLVRDAANRRLPIMRHILATNLGWSLFSERRDWRLRVLIPAGTAEFITSDQPTQNLLPPETHNGLAFYYPVSPRVAALLEHRGNESVVGSMDQISDLVVETLNIRVHNSSHEQVFGTDRHYLESLARRVR